MYRSKPLSVAFSKPFFQCFWLATSAVLFWDISTVILAGIGAVGGLFGMSEAGNAFNGREAIGFWAVIGVVLVLAGLALVAGATLGRIDRERWLVTGLISIASFFWFV